MVLFPHNEFTKAYRRPAFSILSIIIIHKEIQKFQPKKENTQGIFNKKPYTVG